MTYRLAIFETHPIQYKVPWFRALAARPDIDLTVFYCMIPDAHQQGKGFGVQFQWDLPLLEGYRHVVLENVAKHPDVTCFRGCDTPGIRKWLGGWGGKACVCASVDGASVVADSGLGTPPTSDLRSLTSVPASDRRSRPFDAVVVNGWFTKAHLKCIWACRRLRIPVLMRGDSHALTKRPLAKRLIHRLIFAQCRGFLCVGKANADLYRNGGVRESRLFFAPHCVDNRRFDRAAAGQRKSGRVKWGVPQDAVCFLYCGKFEAVKRPIDMLGAVRVLAHVTDAPAPVHLLMVGDGELRAECEAYAREHRLPVTFAGFLNQGQLPGAYATADCLVLCSQSETWGLVVNEAMACGLPAITSDRVGCHPDLILPGVTGQTFPCGDVAALAETMRCLAADPAALRAMGDRAREHIRGYSIDALVEGTMAALRAACGETAHGPHA